jgi:multisubunit Na+/H+ antiporter MnhB subunit
MLDVIQIPGLALLALVIVSFVINILAVSLRWVFKALFKTELTKFAVQVVAFVLSLGAVIGSFFLNGAVLPVGQDAWAQFIIVIYGAQMLSYELVFQRLMDKLFPSA